MSLHDLTIDEKITTPDQVRSLDVDLSQSKGPTYRMGMEAVIGSLSGSDKRQGFTITYLRCKRCLTEKDQTNNEKLDKCSFCGGTDFAPYDRLHGDTVGEIVNRKTFYKCRECGKQYTDPTRQCCSYNYLFSQKATQSLLPQRGYQCLGCFSIYERKFDCCCENGVKKQMVSGQFYPEGIIPQRSLKVLGV